MNNKTANDDPVPTWLIKRRLWDEVEDFTVSDVVNVKIKAKGKGGM